jgi:hypothetical protein
MKAARFAPACLVVTVLVGSVVGIEHAPRRKGGDQGVGERGGMVLSKRVIVEDLPESIQAYFPGVEIACEFARNGWNSLWPEGDRLSWLESGATLRSLLSSKSAWRKWLRRWTIHSVLCNGA